MSLWVYESMSLWVSESMSLWVHGSTGPRVHGSTSPRVHESTGPRVYKSKSPLVWVQEVTSIKIGFFVQRYFYKRSVIETKINMWRTNYCREASVIRTLIKRIKVHILLRQEPITWAPACVTVWTSVRRDLPPEVYVTRDFFLPLSKNLKISLGHLNAVLSIGDAFVFRIFLRETGSCCPLPCPEVLLWFQW